MPQPKKLIEVAMPVKEVSAESVRDKSIRHGHISTLHLWWARRPLPVCRAVVFASLVPDPLDPDCPPAFKEAVELLLGKKGNPVDVYKPYDDIPYTSAIDRMEDNLRNRLLMFIGKFSDEFAQNEKLGKSTPSNKQISNYSLIKWESKNNDAIINKARKLIWVAHNANNDANAATLLCDFDKHYKAIKDAEQALYIIPNRHLATGEVKQKEEALQIAIDAFLDKMPKVFDPFAGGGAIPLEAARLGCRSYGNDINPVAHIIQRGSLEFPQKYGKPITYSKEEFIKLYGEKLWKEQPQQSKIVKNGDAVAVKVENRLAFDVEFYANKLLSVTEKEIGHLYPADKEGNKPIAYYWTRVGICGNPSCKAKVPLLRQFYLSQRRGANKSEWVHFKPVIKGSLIKLEIAKGEINEPGWLNNNKLICPCCGNITADIKNQSINGTLSVQLIATIEQTERGKLFRVPTEVELKVLNEVPNEDNIHESIVKGDSRNLWITLWGISTWGQLFSKRQLLVLNTLSKSVEGIIPDKINNDYLKAICTYLGILIDRVAMRNNQHSRWHIQQDTIENVFGRQAIQMIMDFPEMNPFSDFTSSAKNQITQIVDYILNEGELFNIAKCNHSESGDRTQFPLKSLDAVVTDPPYYDAIAYADLSDFFYVWLKRSIGRYYTENFATPLTPKSEECTALKHHHSDSFDNAKRHFENKLMNIFSAIESQTSGLVSIMFAHQSTEAWTTLCNSILGSRMNITGSWAVDTEATKGLKADKGYLSSSVTVSCIPSTQLGYGDYKEVRKSIEKTVAKEVDELYHLGFRGADLLTACFGQAVSEFGKYERVEKPDGSEVTVAELLEMAREAAFNALLKGFDGDEFTKFYIGWLQLYGFAESEFDDAAKFSRVGLSINVSELFTEHILIRNGNKQTLATFEERLKKNKKLGEAASSFLIDRVHRAMALYKGTNRNALLQYIAKVAPLAESSFWRVVTSLDELLPKGSEDQKQVNGLLTNRDSLIRESKLVQTTTTEQANLFE